jgi:hypothetical protein
MPTPSELVTDAFTQAQAYADSAQAQLAIFTAKLNDAVQLAPLMDAAFAAIEDPGVDTVAAFEAPADYTDTLLTNLAATLITSLAGGTGLVPAVETAIWDRAREREIATAQAAIDTITIQSESLGYELPPGVLNDGIRRETRAYFDKVSTLSRDIAVKQAELEQANMQKAIDQCTAYEAMLAEIQAKRASVAVEAYKAEILRFQAQVEQAVKHWEVQIKQLEAQQTYILEAQKINTEVIRANLSSVLEAAKVGAQVYAQLVASAYSLIHASASVSSGASMSVGYSYSNDTESAAPTTTAI